MRLKHIIKVFNFVEEKRSLITLGTDVRLHPTQHHLQLKQGASGYPTDFDLYVKTWTTTPRSMKRWVGFMAEVVNYKNTANVYVTDIRYRLSDGTQELYWNTGASAWVPAASNNWNTEAEIADNISSFPISTQTIQVVINLRTTNSSYTPLVKSIRILYESDLEEMEDYVWRSLLPDMEAKIQPIAEHAIEKDVASNTIDLNDYPIETPYEIVSMDTVYDLDSDPNKQNNILDSYNDATQIITLTTSISAGNTVMIRFLYRPVVAVTTGQDYVELEKVPEIIFEDVTKVNDNEQVGVDYVLNKRTGLGKKVPVTQSCIEIQGRFITDKGKDHARLSDAIRRYFQNNPLLRSVGMDDDFGLLLLDEHDQDTVPNQKDLQAGRFRFRIVKAVFFDNDAENIYGIKRVVVTGGNLETPKDASPPEGMAVSAGGVNVTTNEVQVVAGI